MEFRRVLPIMLAAMAVIIIGPSARAQSGSIFVNGASDSGVMVYQVGAPIGFLAWSVLDDGYQVASADGRGLYVGNTSWEGVKVYHSALDGLSVQYAGSPVAAPISSPMNNGLEIWGAQGNGVFVGASDGDGVHVESGGVNAGYFNTNVSSGTGVIGIANYGAAAYGVWGASSSGYAGVFSGKVDISGNLHVGGTLTKSAGTFRIDDPLDPENKFLSHSFVESPDMKNVYDGVVTLDDPGEAEVELPDYFEALNRDFRYQLTTIGAAAAVYIAEEIHDNRFKIAGGTDGLKVSWQVTGIRKDPYAVDHPVEVEAWKPDAERGRFLYPAGYGMPDTLSIALAPQKPVPSQPVIYNPSDESQRIVHRTEAPQP
jgi:hypothetical protein